MELVVTRGCKGRQYNQRGLDKFMKNKIESYCIANRDVSSDIPTLIRVDAREDLMGWITRGMPCSYILP